MTSRKVEDVHHQLLEQLLLDSGLECPLSPYSSTESTESIKSAEEHAPVVEEEEPHVEAVEEEEPPAPLEEEVQEELPHIFPTPSLRHILSDKIRKIEKQNRIHVLPEEFKIKIDPKAIPKIANTAQQTYIDTLADLTGCKRYKSSLAEFWFLDTLANLLRRAQEDDLDRPTQAILILWFCEWMKEMEYFDAADRKRMMRRFQDNMQKAAKFIAEEAYIPTPAEAGVYYKAQDDTDRDHESVRDSPNKTTYGYKHLVNFRGTVYECCMRDLAKIIHYIFDLFSTDYQYDLVRSVFTHTPEYTLIDAPCQIINPKRLYMSQKTKAPKKEKSPKKEKQAGIKGKKKDHIETEEYLALMELKAREEKYLEEEEERDREMWARRSHILPLTYATNEEFFNKYWPQPPPSEADVKEEHHKGKGKKKG